MLEEWMCCDEKFYQITKRFFSDLRYSKLPPWKLGRFKFLLQLTKQISGQAGQVKDFTAGLHYTKKMENMFKVELAHTSIPVDGVMSRAKAAVLQFLLDRLRTKVDSLSYLLYLKTRFLSLTECYPLLRTCVVDHRPGRWIRRGRWSVWRWSSFPSHMLQALTLWVRWDMERMEILGAAFI